MRKLATEHVVALVAALIVAVGAIAAAVIDDSERPSSVVGEPTTTGQSAPTPAQTSPTPRKPTPTPTPDPYRRLYARTLYVPSTCYDVYIDLDSGAVFTDPPREGTDAIYTDCYSPHLYATEDAWSARGVTRQTSPSDCEDAIDTAPISDDVSPVVGDAYCVRWNDDRLIARIVVKDRAPDNDLTLRVTAWAKRQ